MTVLRLMIGLCAIGVLATMEQMAEGQDKHAIAIGVESYPEDFQPLDYAAADARAIGEIFTQAGFDTTVMTGDQRNSSLKPTTPKKILNALDKRLKNCSNGDTVVVFLSGHGIQFQDDPLLKSGVRETYFCPEDADLDSKDSLVSINDDIIKRLNDCAATRKLLLVDTCRASVLSEAGQKKHRGRIDTSPNHESSRSVPGGISVFFSCQSEQASWEHSKLKHSVFTNFLVDYFSGKAEPSFYENQKSTLLGMTKFVRKQTNSYVVDNGLSSDGQSPVLRGSEADWPITNVTVVSQPQAPVATALRRKSNSIGMEFLLVPSGEFYMGTPLGERFRAPDELQHEVELSDDFWMGVHEVTQKQWRQIMKTTPWKDQGSAQDGDSFAASYISWNAANEFCLKLSLQDKYEYRLPTEAEWEYACRAGTKTTFSFGNTWDELEEFGWVDFNASGIGESYPHQVGAKKANPYGLHDMHGNVWEWCSDWYDADYYKNSPEVDPQGPRSGESKVMRGGCFL